LPLLNPSTLIVFGYLIVVTVAGVAMRGRLQNSSDYFLAARSMSWWAVCLSVVATETSTLTFISVPGLAYIANLNFLQVALGYILGRFIVSFVLLPSYFRGQLNTSYELLHQRFGLRARALSSIIFIITRVLADSVRLFATAIPLSLMTGWGLPASIAAIAFFTIIYTVVGGIRSVVWMDVLQMGLYLAGALIAGAFILHKLPDDLPHTIETAHAAGKLALFNLGLHLSPTQFFKNNYTLASGLICGAFLSMASHGTDHIIVQRLLTCRSVRAAQSALIFSGLVVFLQFLLFLLIGVLLFLFYGGAAIPPDQVFPRFIIEEMPPVLSGLIVASLFAAAMSTLSSSLNSLASSTLFDLILPKKTQHSGSNLCLSRILTIVWGSIFVGIALLLRKSNNPVVELGLSIVSFTYGGILGAFLLSAKKNRPSESTILIALWTTLTGMIWFIGPPTAVQLIMVIAAVSLGIWIFNNLGHLRERLEFCAATAICAALLVFAPSPQAAWTWYVPVGTVMMLSVGSMLNFLEKL
jgi:solute:Na+ symporter, SSS family